MRYLSLRCTALADLIPSILSPPDNPVDTSIKFTETVAREGLDRDHRRRLRQRGRRDRYGALRERGRREELTFVVVWSELAAARTFSIRPDQSGED